MNPVRAPLLVLHSRPTKNNVSLRSSIILRNFYPRFTIFISIIQLAYRHFYALVKFVVLFIIIRFFQYRCFLPLTTNLIRYRVLHNSIIKPFLVVITNTRRPIVQLFSFCFYVLSWRLVSFYELSNSDISWN